jgi:hypothetical protein
MQARTKRDVIQAILDEERDLWIIMKPSRQDPSDSESLCILENPAAQTQATAEIPNAWFENEELGRIKDAIQESLHRAVPKLKPLRDTPASEDC